MSTLRGLTVIFIFQFTESRCLISSLTSVLNHYLSIISDGNDLHCGKDELILILCRKLVGYRVDSIFSNKDYRLRQKALDTFRSGETWLLISTEVLARGIDFVGIRTVINYDCPASIDDYVHRIGRTGRGQSKGTAVTFFTEDDGPIVRSIAHMAKSMGQAVPQWMLSMQRNPHHKASKRQRQ